MSGLSPGRALFGPLLEVAREGRDWDLVAVDLEQGPTVTVRRGERVLAVELGPHDETAPCYARTERFNVYTRRLSQGEARPFDDTDRHVADEVLRALRKGERALPRFERPATTTRTAVREIRVERVLVPEGAGQYYVNPYVGCMIGCRFCWVSERADLSRSLAGMPEIPWGRWVDAKVNAPEVLAEEVRRAPPGPVRLSPVVTDPYQPIERHYRITRRSIEVLGAAGFTPVVLTRATRVLDDLALLASIPDAAVGLSIPTDDDRIRQRFEPGADPIEERIDALARLHDAGLRTFVVIQPVLPMSPRRLASLVAPFVSFARIDRMHSAGRGMPPAFMEAGEDGFFGPVAERLHRELVSRGVRIDGLDDMARLVGGAV